MNENLQNRRVAILVTDGVEQSELQGPLDALKKAGANVAIISPKPGKIQAMVHADKGEQFKVDETIANANPADYDALVIPGGLYNPDTLRSTPAAVEFVRSFARTGRPLAAICHGPWMLIEAEVVRGRRMTSWPAIQTDVRNAGGNWTDQEVVVDQNLITSRKPADVPAFCARLIEQIAQSGGGQAQQKRPAAAAAGAR